MLFPFKKQTTFQKKNVAPSFCALKEQDISWHEKDIDLKYRL